MRIFVFARRCAKEIVRDPLSIVFGVGFPVILLIFMTILKQSIRGMPEEMFALDTFTPGMIVFGQSFIMLFLGMLVMNDRNSSFLPRLYSSPMTAADYIFGYVLPMIPIGMAQTLFGFITAWILGLKPSVYVLAVMLITVPVTLLFASLGLLLGVLFSTPAVNGISSIIINVSALLSGTWFSLDLIGGSFKTFCNCLPFAHAVNAAANALSGDFSELLTDILWIFGYTAVFFFFGAVIFKKKMKD